MYQRDSVNKLGAEQFSSLNFLRKPQRIVNQVKNSFNDDVLKRNTDLNKSKLIVEDDAKENIDLTLASQLEVSLSLDDDKDPLEEEKWAKDSEEVEMTRDYFPSTEIQVTNIGERPRQGQFYVYGSAEEQSSGQDTTETEEEEEMHQRLKLKEEPRSDRRPSILLQRSKSLPTTPSETVSGEDKSPPVFKRSKSVHFAQSEKFEVKYYREDESPLILRNGDEEENFRTRIQKFRKSRRHRDREGKNKPSKKTVTLENGNLVLRAISPSMLKLDIFSMMRDRPSLETAGNSDIPYNPSDDRYLKNTGITTKGQPVAEPTDRNIDVQASLDAHTFKNAGNEFICHLYDLKLNSTASMLIGNIIVRNISYEKRVMLRYTQDGWKSQHDIESVWISHDQDIRIGGGFLDIDVFQFAIELSELRDSINFEMCILYQTREGTTWVDHWDNNGGNNYRVNVRLS